MKITGITIKYLDKEYFKPINCKLFKMLKIRLFEKGNKYVPMVCIMEEVVSEDYDYNYDDELEYIGLDCHVNYYPIKYCPFTGKKYEFVSKETIDITNDFNKLQKEIDSLKGYSKKVLKNRSELYEKQNALFQGVLSLIN